MISPSHLAHLTAPEIPIVWLVRVAPDQEEDPLQGEDRYTTALRLANPAAVVLSVPVLSTRYLPHDVGVEAEEYFTAIVFTSKRAVTGYRRQLAGSDHQHRGEKLLCFAVGESTASEVQRAFGDENVTGLISPP